MNPEGEDLNDPELPTSKTALDIDRTILCQQGKVLPHEDILNGQQTSHHSLHMNVLVKESLSVTSYVLTIHKQITPY